LRKVSGARKRKKRPSPLSLRLSVEERAELEKAAAGMPLNRFVKSKVFDGKLKPRRTRGQHPVKDHKALGQIMGLLGKMDLGPSLETLANAAKIGALPMTPETEEELSNACAAVIAIRTELMRALGYSIETEE